MIRKIISGFQDGADIAGIHFAAENGIQTGGHIPAGFKTQSGFRPNYKALYNAIEDDSPLYPPRTEKNVINSDGTARFAFHFASAGEKCTLKFIKKHNKPYIDISLGGMNESNVMNDILLFSEFIKVNNIHILNIAGNSPKTHSSTYAFTKRFLTLWLQYENDPKNFLYK